MPHLRIHSIETLGAHDGPGLRLVVFAQGCPMRCVYCHNPDTFDATAGTLVPVAELVARALRQKAYFGSNGGVTVSGGEPSLQRVALSVFFRQLHTSGIHTCLDTNVGVFDDALKSLYAETDLLLLDIKHIDAAAHQRLTGVPNTTPLAVAAYRESTGKPMWLRYVLVPGWTDEADALSQWARHFANYRTVERVEILPFHQLGKHKWKQLSLPYPLEDVRPPSLEEKERAHRIFAEYFACVVMK